MATPQVHPTDTQADELFLELWQLLCSVFQGVETGRGGQYLIIEVNSRLVAVQRFKTSQSQEAVFHMVTDLAETLNLVSIGAPLHAFLIMRVRTVTELFGKLAWSIQSQQEIATSSMGVVLELENRIDTLLSTPSV